MSVTAAARVTPAKVTDGRRALLAKVHIARAQLAVEESSYRAILQRVAGVDSAAKASEPKLVAVLDEFRRLGWDEKRRQAGSGRSGRGTDPREQAQKLRALWLSLWQLGEVQNRTDDALAAFVMRHTQMAALRWNSPRDLNIAIECLKRWCGRIGYVPKPFDAVVVTPMQGRFEPALIEAQWRRLEQLDAFRHGSAARLDTWLHRQGFLVTAPQFLEEAQAAFVVAELGRWIRRQRLRQAAADGVGADVDGPA